MPWRQVDPMTERLRFIAEVRQRVASVSELCQHYEISRVTDYKWLRRADRIRWHRHWVNVSHVLGGEYVGFTEVDDGEWDLYFGPVKLGRLHERLLRIEDACGRLARHHARV